MCHAALKLLYTAGVVDVKCLFNRTDFQINKPIKLLRRKLEVLLETRKATENALAYAFARHPSFPSGEAGTILDSALKEAWEKFKSHGLSTGDVSFRISIKVLEITSQLFLFIDASRHGLIEIPLLIEHQWAGVFQALKKINYAHAMVSSRVNPYARSAFSNEQLRRSRVISLTGRKGENTFFGYHQENIVHVLKDVARHSRDLTAVALAAGYCSHLAQVQRFSYRISLLRVPSSIHMVSSRAREILLLTAAMKHMQIGEADTRRTNKCSPLAGFVRARFIQVEGNQVSEILNLPCFTPGGQDGFPIIQTQALAMRVPGSTKICNEGSLLIGWSSGYPNVQCANRMHFSFAGNYLRSDSGSSVSLASLLGKTVTVKADLKTTSVGFDIHEHGAVSSVIRNGQGDSLGLVAGKVRVSSVGGNKIQADTSKADIVDMMKKKGAEGRRYRTFEFELSPFDVSKMTLWIYQKDAAAHHRQGMLNTGDKAGAESRTRQKQQDQKLNETKGRGTSELSQAEMTRLSFDKLINVTLHHEKSDVTQFHTVPSSIRNTRTSKQDLEPPHKMIVDSSELIFDASSKYTSKAVERYLTRRGKDETRSVLLANLLRGTVKPRVVTFSDQMTTDRLASIDKMTRDSTIRMNALKKMQISTANELVQLINAPEAYKSVNHNKIMQLEQAILTLNTAQHREEVLRIHRSGLRERIMNRGENDQENGASLQESVGAMSDAIHLSSFFTAEMHEELETLSSPDSGQHEPTVTNNEVLSHDMRSQDSEFDSEESDSEDSEDDGADWEEFRQSRKPGGLDVDSDGE